jgi:hypothetical protein
MTARIFVPDIPEFLPIVSAARVAPGCRVQAAVRGYWRIEADAVIRLDRKQMKLGPALWNSLLSGGFHGRIEEYGRDQLTLRDCD